MKKIALLLISILLLSLLCSCELVYKAPEVGKMHILVYGNDYTATAKPLHKTINDAIQVGNVLIKLCEETDIDHDIVYLIGSSTAENSNAIESDKVINDVSTSRVKSTLTAMASSDYTADNDITVIYFSCHGSSAIAKKTKVDYGFDTATISYIALNQTSESGSPYELIEFSEIQDLILDIPGTTVVISDFCYSGGFIQSDYVSVTSGEYSGMDATTLFGLRDKIDEVSEELELGSTYWLSAARYNQESLENVPLHGNFTAALLDALGWDEDNYTLTTAKALKNGRITLFNVANYCEENDKNAYQTPMLSGGSNDVILFSF